MLLKSIKTNVNIFNPSNSSIRLTDSMTASDKEFLDIVQMDYSLTSLVSPQNISNENAALNGSNENDILYNSQNHSNIGY
jgi:hypothetical protein